MSSADSLKNLIDYTEHEVLVLTEGQYFGEWGVLERKLRNASAVAAEDSDIFLLDTKSFEQSLGVSR